MPGGHTAPRDRMIDRILTGRLLGYPLMIALLALVFYLTIRGANYPSQWLSRGLFCIYDSLLEGFRALAPRPGSPGCWWRGPTRPWPGWCR